MVGMNKEIEREFYKLLCYMIVSARNLNDETKMYGPFRLLDAGSRLVKILDKNDQSSATLSKIKRNIDDNKYKVMTDQQGFIESLDELILDLVDDMDEEL